MIGTAENTNIFSNFLLKLTNTHIKDNVIKERAKTAGRLLHYRISQETVDRITVHEMHYLSDSPHPPQCSVCKLV